MDITRGVKFLQMGASIRSFFHATFSLFVTPDATVKTHVYEPYFFKLVSIGSPIVLDDYCYSEIYREQKSSWDDFAKKKNISILSLPTGQGVFFKI